MVIDVDTDAELKPVGGCHQLCSPERAGTYMRVSPTRYRWEFRLLDGETAADYQTIAAIEPLIRPWLGDTPPTRWSWCASPPTLPRASGQPLARPQCVHPG